MPTHWPEQFCSLPLHAAMHLPPVQGTPASQARPHLPQLAGSVCTSTLPPTQVVVHVPLFVLHVLVCVPQVPQAPAGALPLQLQVVSHWQSLPHDCEPPSGPHACVAPGMHAPVLVHVLFHVPVLGSHVLDNVPQAPHEPAGGLPGQLHVAGHLQSMPHV
jgi:hypothetical protein